MRRLATILRKRYVAAFMLAILATYPVELLMVVPQYFLQRRIAEAINFVGPRFSSQFVGILPPRPIPYQILVLELGGAVVTVGAWFLVARWIYPEAAHRKQ